MPEVIVKYLFCKRIPKDFLKLGLEISEKFPTGLKAEITKVFDGVT